MKWFLRLFRRKPAPVQAGQLSAETKRRLLQAHIIKATPWL